MSKILLALQFWEGDKAAANRLAKAITDLEPRFSEHADFLLSSRFDCSVDPDIARYVSRKFNVFTHVNRTRREKGWPGGCNGLWFGTLDHIWDLNRSRKMPTYKAVLTFEADAFPLRQDWIPRLHDIWDQANARRPVKVVGALIPGSYEHINGNALFSGDPEFLFRMGRKVSGCRPDGGWDYVYAPMFKQMGWADSPRIQSWWRCPTVTKETFESLVAKDVVLLHGVKDDSVIRHLREKYSLKS